MVPTYCTVHVWAFTVPLVQYCTYLQYSTVQYSTYCMYSTTSGTVQSKMINGPVICKSSQRSCHTRSFLAVQVLIGRGPWVDYATPSRGTGYNEHSRVHNQPKWYTPPWPPNVKRTTGAPLSKWLTLRRCATPHAFLSVGQAVGVRAIVCKHTQERGCCLDNPNQ